MPVWLRSLLRLWLPRVSLSLILLSLLLGPAVRAEEPPVPGGIDGTARLPMSAADLQRFVCQPLQSEELLAAGKANAQGELQSDTVGQQRDFWAYDFTTGEYYRTTATCRRVGAHCYIYVQDTYSANETKLTALVNAFDSNIYPQEHTTLGEEPLPGIDADERLYILLLDIRDGYHSGNLTFTATYFDPRNEYRNADLPAAERYSNEKELAYVDINPGILGDADFHGAVTFGLAMLIQWRADPAEPNWVEYGCADLARLRCGYGARKIILVTNAPSVPGFLQAPDQSLVRTAEQWRNASNGLAAQGAAFLWATYLYDHYGGDAFIHRLVADPAQGIAGINSALAATGASDRFEQAFKKWVVANYLDDGTGPYGYASLQLLASGWDNVSTFPRAAVANSHTSYPVATQTRCLNYWAGAAIKFGSGTNRTLSMRLDGSDGNRYAAMLVRSTNDYYGVGTNTVQEVPVDAVGDALAQVAGFGGTVRTVLLVPISMANSGGRAYTYSAALANMTRRIQLPLARSTKGADPTPGPATGINGRLTFHGAAAAGVWVTLNYYNGTQWSILDTTLTNGDGRYSFTCAPALSAGRILYVGYENSGAAPNPGPGYLWAWSGNKITSYSAGATVAGGDFDLADVALVSPADGAQVTLPFQFCWTPRGIAGDNYQVAIYNPETDEAASTGYLGAIGCVGMAALPTGWEAGRTYQWWVRVFQGSDPEAVPYNMGVAYGTNTVTINAGGSGSMAWEITPGTGR